MNKILVSLALLLAPAASFAGDGDLTPPPVAHGRQSQATIGHECQTFHPDPCKQANIVGGTAQCVDGEWVCSSGCAGGPPPCVAGKSGQCVGGQWQCVITDGCALEILCASGTHRECQNGQNACVADATCTGTPQCGLVLRPVCVNGSWECWTPNGGGAGSDPGSARNDPTIGGGFGSNDAGSPRQGGPAPQGTVGGGAGSPPSSGANAGQGNGSAPGPSSRLGGQ